MSCVIGFLQFWLIFIFANYAHGVLNATRMSELHKKMKNEYDPKVVPIEGDQPVNVTVQMIILDMFPYQAIHMHYSADFFLKLQWYDYRLAFDKNDNKTFMPLYGDLVWKPDIYFPQGRQGQMQKIPEDIEGSHLYMNGTVVHFQRITLVSLCLMELHFYPFDIQNCTFEITTLVNSNEFVRLFWNKPAVHTDKNKLEMMEFNIVKYSTEVVTKKTGRDAEFDFLRLNFRFYRYLAFYFLRDFFPCILIVILSWMTFWIDYTSTPARVAMGITTVLTIVTMTNNIRNNSPPAGLFRSIDYYLLMCNLFVFAALTEYALVGMAKGNRSKKKVSKSKTGDVKLYDFSGIGDIVDNEEKGIDKNRNKSEIKPNTNARSDHKIDKISRILFPTMFVVFNAIYFAFHRLHEDTVD